MPFFEILHVKHGLEKIPLANLSQNHLSFSKLSEDLKIGHTLATNH